MKTLALMWLTLVIAQTPLHAETDFSVHGVNNCTSNPPGSGPGFTLAAGTHPVEFLGGAWSLWNSEGQNGGQEWVTVVRVWIHATNEIVPMFNTGFHPSQATAQAAAQGMVFPLELSVASQVTFFVHDGGGCGDNRGSVMLRLQDQQVAAAFDTPSHFQLLDNHPNPFNPSTQLRFSLDHTAQVELTVFNLQGEMVARPLNDLVAGGEHSVLFDASQLPSGCYVYRLESEGRQQTRKMLLLK